MAKNKKIIKECVICKEVIPQTIIGEFIWDDGHNAEPVKKGRCCTHCNDTVVIPTRISLLVKSQ
jgi:hypothetical protein